MACKNVRLKTRVILKLFDYGNGTKSFDNDKIQTLNYYAIN